MLTLAGVKALRLSIGDCTVGAECGHEQSMKLLLGRVESRLREVSANDERFLSPAFLQRFGWALPYTATATCAAASVTAASVSKPAPAKPAAAKKAAAVTPPVVATRPMAIVSPPAKVAPATKGVRRSSKSAVDNLMAISREVYSPGPAKVGAPAEGMNAHFLRDTEGSGAGGRTRRVHL